MIKIKRKIVLHGPSTLTISLPSSWVKRFNIKKGDELNLEEFGKELRVSSEKISELKKKQINLKNLGKIGKSYLTSAYRQGYNEIELNYGDDNYIGVIQDILSKEITGFEIIKQNHYGCLIKDLTGENQGEFDNVLRRIWLLLLDLSRASLRAFRKKDSKALREIYLMDFIINKFCNYCLRLLNEKGHKDFKKTPLYYHFIKELEELADSYKDLCTFYSDSPQKINDNLITALTRINDHVKAFYHLFYNYNEKKMEDLFRKIELTQKKIVCSQPCPSALLSLHENAKNLSRMLIEINS